MSCPQTGVIRHALNFKSMSITGLMAEADGVKVAPSCGDGPLAKVRNGRIEIRTQPPLFYEKSASLTKYVLLRCPSVSST